jgi:hypothetical protein
VVIAAGSVTWAKGAKGVLVVVGTAESTENDEAEAGIEEADTDVEADPPEGVILVTSEVVLVVVSARGNDIEEVVVAQATSAKTDDGGLTGPNEAAASYERDEAV